MEVFGFKELDRQKDRSKRSKIAQKSLILNLKSHFFFLNLGFLVFFGELEGLFSRLKGFEMYRLSRIFKKKQFEIK